jgi:hypothetical protein
MVTDIPPTFTLRVLTGDARIVTVPPVAVNGPRVAGDDGTTSVSPEGGIGFGIGMSRLIAPVERVDGEAPTAERLPVEVPVIAVAPTAAASCATSGGMVDVDW